MVKLRGWLRKPRNRAKVKRTIGRIGKGAVKAVRKTYSGTKTAARAVQRERAEWRSIAKSHRRTRKKKRTTRRKRRKKRWTSRHGEPCGLFDDVL